MSTYKEEDLINTPDVAKGVLKGKRWLPRDVSKLCYENGWKDPINLTLFVATIGGESAFYEEAEGDPHDDGTIDLGLFQLNSIHAHEWAMTDEAFKAMAFDPSVAIVYARKLWNLAKSHGGSGFEPWYAYSNGGYKRHMLGAIVGVGNFLAVSQGYEPNVRWMG